MINDLKLFEVREIEPETVDYYLLMQKDLDEKIEQRWSMIYMANNYEWVANSVDSTKESNKKYYPDKNFELKIFCIKLPS